MSDIKNGGAAFPQGKAVGSVSLLEGGMTLRDYFAAKAMQGLLAAQVHGFNDLPAKGPFGKHGLRNGRRHAQGAQQMTNPTQRQVGGDHYTKLAIQPMQYSMANGLNALQHTIVKYVTRYKDKGGIEDLRKAAHCIELLIQHEMGVAAERNVSGASPKQPYHDIVLHGHELYSEEDERRMDVVGQNGNNGMHYLGGHPLT